MPDLRRVTFVAISSILLFGTIYSVAFHTYLDTSDPLLTHLKHPHHDKSYFARKQNILNVVFIKRAWGWTSAAFAALTLTSPRRTDARWVMGRLGQWAAATAVWLGFVVWFFGPAVIERVTTLSGGSCVVSLPGGGVHTIPAEVCYARETISLQTHPELFISPFVLPDDDWSTKPRLLRGHDISGHVFLLTMSALFLADQLRHSINLRSRPQNHTIAIGATGALIGVWLFATYTTSLYFHSPFEKLTGFLGGVAGFLITQLPIFGNNLIPEVIEPERRHQD